ncbi:hypothetical protein GFL24_36130 [Rhizobium laguerreae]|nr:hypothetical protein [Rhizobium laguerreae]
MKFRSNRSIPCSARRTLRGICASCAVSRKDRTATKTKSNLAVPKTDAGTGAGLGAAGGGVGLLTGLGLLAILGGDP